jgi:hypothetical protein
VRHGIGARAATIIHEPGKALLSSGQLIRQPPIAAESAIDELNVAVLIEYDDAVVQVIHKRA